MTRRLLAGLLLAVLSGAGLVSVAAAPSFAEEPVGGCWVWYSGVPQRDISSKVAPWANPETSPKGPADHTIKLSPKAPPAGSQGKITYSYNKGPENAGPPAQVTGTFRFTINNNQKVSKTINFGTVSTGQSIPSRTFTLPFEVEEGDNVAVFQGATFDASAFSVKIDCNGQTSGTPESNPRNDPKPTNITATVTSEGQADPTTDTPDPTDASVLCPLIEALPFPLPGADCAPADGNGDGDGDGDGDADGDGNGDGNSDGDGNGDGNGNGDSDGGGDPSTTGDNGDGGGTGTPASGEVEFACVLSPFESDFEYNPQVSVFGSPGGAGQVSLLAEMGNLPGIAPVPIDGRMEVTLGLTADGKATTLKGASDVKAAPQAEVPVPPLTGSVASGADNLPVTLTSFGFFFPSYDIRATCKPVSGQDLGALTVGASGAGPSSSGGSGGSDGTSTGTDSGVSTAVPTGDAPLAEPGVSPGLPAGAVYSGLSLVDARLEGGTSFGELFGAAPSRTLVVVVQNPSNQVVTNPVMRVAVGRSGADATMVAVSLGTLQPQEMRRVQMPVALSSSGFGTYHVLGQVGDTQTAAFDTSWRSYPWGLMVLLVLALVFVRTAWLRERRATPSPVARAASGGDRSDGGTTQDAVVDLEQLDRWWGRGPRLAQPTRLARLGFQRS